MSRLPTVSGDGNAWGTILNDFLSVSHNSDGTLKKRWVNLADFCAIDGTTDDSTGFTTAYALAASLGAGLFMSGGTLVKGNDTLLSGVPIDLGGGTIKLKNGANTDLFSAFTSSINLAAAAGSGSNTAVHDFSIRNGTLDGNMANQSAGPSYPLRFYGYGFTFEGLEVTGGFSGNVLHDYHGAFPANGRLEGRLRNFRIHNCNGIGLQVGGPSDCQWSDGEVYSSASHDIHIAPNAFSYQATSVHAWNPGNGNANAALAWLIESSITCDNCEGEGSSTLQVAYATATNLSWIGGAIFDAGLNGNCIQIGQAAGQTPFAGQINQAAGVTTAQQAANYLIVTNFQITGTPASGAVVFGNDGGGIISSQFNLAHGAEFTGTAANSTLTQYQSTVVGVHNAHFSVGSLTTDLTAKSTALNTVPASGIALVVDPGANSADGVTILAHGSSYTGTLLKVQNHSFGNVFTVVESGDIFSTGGIRLGAQSTIYSGTGAPGTGVGAIGDYYFRSDTPSTANQRIYVKTGASTWTGIV